MRTFVIATVAVCVVWTRPSYGQADRTGEWLDQLNVVGPVSAGIRCRTLFAGPARLDRVPNEIFVGHVLPSPASGDDIADRALGVAVRDGMCCSIRHMNSVLRDSGGLETNSGQVPAPYCRVLRAATLDRGHRQVQSHLLWDRAEQNRDRD